ncbi:chromate resistance protein ChrB domain-containing protein [Thermococcus sp. JdF3]
MPWLIKRFVDPEAEFIFVPAIPARRPSRGNTL